MILVTGATGLLGSHLLSDLVGSGREVRAIRRDPGRLQDVRRVFGYYHPDPDGLFRRIQWVEADLLDPGSMEDALEGISEVYHVAAMVSFRDADLRMMRRVNMEGTAILADLANLRKVERFCHVSSIAALGRSDDGGPVTENNHWEPRAGSSGYGMTKYEAEREVWRAIEEGLKAVIINPSVILGPGFWDGGSRLFRLVKEGLRFYSAGSNGFVDVRDVSSAMIRLMDSGITGERYICSAENRTYRDLFSRMAHCLGRPAPALRVPPSLAPLVWRAEALRSRLTGTDPFITRELARTASRSFACSAGKLIRETGFAFRPLDQTIEDICALYPDD